MDLVLYHHNHTKSNYPDLCSILRKADHHSASEREDIDDTQEVNETPLISLFSAIFLHPHIGHLFPFNIIDPHSLQKSIIYIFY